MKKWIVSFFVWLCLMFGLSFSTTILNYMAGTAELGAVIVFLCGALVLFAVMWALIAFGKPFSERFDNRWSAPLKYHKFLHYVGLPVSALLIIGNIGMTLEIVLPTGLTTYYYVDIAFRFISLALTLVCFVGFFKWSPYAWYSLMANYVISFIHHIFVMIVAAIHASPQLNTHCGTFAGSVSVSVLVMIYYRNRKQLFTSDVISNYTPPAQTDVASPPSIVAASEPTNTLNVEAATSSFTNNPAPKNGAQKRYCKYCGGLIDVATKKCTSCGKQFFRFRWKPVFIGLAAFLVVALAGLNVYQYVSHNRYVLEQYEITGDLLLDIEKLEKDKKNLNNTITGLKNDVQSWKNKVNEYKDVVNFMNEYVVIVSDDNTGLYHKYGCKNLDLSYFWAYNIDAAQEKYKPCNICCQ